MTAVTNIYSGTASGNDPLKWSKAAMEALRPRRRRPRPAADGPAQSRAPSDGGPCRIPPSSNTNQLGLASTGRLIWPWCSMVADLRDGLDRTAGTSDQQVRHLSDGRTKSCRRRQPGRRQHRSNPDVPFTKCGDGGRDRDFTPTRDSRLLSSGAAAVKEQPIRPGDLRGGSTSPQQCSEERPRGQRARASAE